MKLREISISNVGCISDLKTSFNEGVNIICGPNGVGKTTILESIASMFTYGSPTVKKKVSSESGNIKIRVNNDGNLHVNEVCITNFSPLETTHALTLSDLAKKLLSIKVARNFSYSLLQAIPSDPERKDPDIWDQSLNGISFTGVKGWFVNRYLFSARPESLSEQQIANFELAESCFSIIHPSYSFF